MELPPLRHQPRMPPAFRLPPRILLLLLPGGPDRRPAIQTAGAAGGSHCFSSSSYYHRMLRTSTTGNNSGAATRPPRPWQPQRRSMSQHLCAPKTQGMIQARRAGRRATLRPVLPPSQVHQPATAARKMTRRFCSRPSMPSSRKQTHPAATYCCDPLLHTPTAHTSSS